MLAANTLLQNRYRVLRELGHGGMGTVYEALDQRVNCIVALKQAAVDKSDDARGAFEREAALLANLRHPSLPKVMDYFSEGERDFLVMEFIPGYDLAELLELRGSPFPEAQVLGWADDLLKVLEYLHRQRPPILHRDIKPSNLKLTKQGEIFLLDFGLAKGAAGQMPTLITSRSMRGYTPVYASLEQIHGHGTDPRSDLYSLSATLYHLLTAVSPRDAPTRFNLIEDEKPDPLQPIQKLNPRCSSCVAAVIQQGMAIPRRQRPAGAAEMRKALREAAEKSEKGASANESRHDKKQREDRFTDETARVRKEETPLPGAESGERQGKPRLDEAGAINRAAVEHQARQKEQVRIAEEARYAEPERVPARDDALIEEERTHSKEKQRPSAYLAPAAQTPTKRSQDPIAPEQSRPQSGVKTLKAIQSGRGLNQSQGHLNGEAFPADASPSSRYAGKRTGLILGVVLISIVAVVLIVWFALKTPTGSQASANGEPSTPVEQVKQTEDNLRPPAGMVYVPGGQFMMGRDDGDQSERPAHEVTVKPFFLDLYEVTNEDYKKCVAAQQCAAPAGWRDSGPSAETRQRPVTGVRWSDANDYGRFVGKRLPTETEWEFAARGADGRLYPWGSSWQANFANADGANRTTSDVGFYKGTSPYGAFDMNGNAWEWTASDLRAYPGGSLPANLPTGDLKVIRGGSYESTKDYATTTYRTGWPARDAPTYAQTGFRCASDLAP
jgi:formylglycine-generating enzyme required for sulfatase activity/predicted Ser/Thr protein kinase